MANEGQFQSSLSGLIGNDEANEVQNKPESSISYGKERGVPVLVDPVIRTNTEADTSLGLDMRVGGDDVSVAKNQP